MKSCTACGVTKEEWEFYVHTNGCLYSECKKCHVVRTNKLHRRNPESSVRSAHKWRLANRKKSRTHRAVYKALRSGRLVKKVCEVCGVKETDAHHEDYARRFDVRWLCRQHHSDVHQLKKLNKIAMIDPKRSDPPAPDTPAE